MITREKAYKLRALIEKATKSLSDDDALEGIELYPHWAPDTSYVIDDRIRYNEKLYKVVQAHTSQLNWTPDVTPALYTEVAPAGTIPVWRQPTGAQDAYNTGDKVHYPGEEDPVYVSLIDANIWSPEAYPAGWQLI